MKRTRLISILVHLLSVGLHNGFTPTHTTYRLGRHTLLPPSTSTTISSTRLFGRRGKGKNDKGRGGGGGGKNTKKQNLPEKTCVVCGRPFTWRKKWERCWDEVTCCSKSCNAKRRAGAVSYEN